MPGRALFGAAVVAAFLSASAFLCGQQPAPTPPMGWTEWDAYGLGVKEAEFRANAEVLAGLRSYGWQYALLDAGWYEQDPTAHDAAGRHYMWDGNGRLQPAANRFPSAAAGTGFRPLADWLHQRGLKLGIHVMLGIPRQAVAADLPIAGSHFHAADAADSSQTCSWDKEFYVVKDNAAGQAWYDSIARQYAGWGIDFIKLGCVADHPFHPSEIRQMSEAIRRSGRPMVLSLSPGPPPQQYAEFAFRTAQMVRFSAEHWDLWVPPAGATNYPVGLREDFDLFAQWEAYVQPGHWLDGDVLADGWLAPHPAWGEPRHSRLTPDEQRSEFALWAFARAPLIEGANLTRLDPLTRSLMTDRELLEIDQHAGEDHPVTHLPPEFEQVRVWEAQVEGHGSSRRYIGLFNLSDSPARLHVRWEELGLPGSRHSARAVWGGRQTGPADSVNVRLPPHGSAVYQVE